MDWMSSLEALKGTLPQGEETPETAPEAASADPVEKARLDILLDEQVEDIARRLRQRLGTGGSSRDGEILIQGDKRREVAAELTAMGLKCRVI